MNARLGGKSAKKVVQVLAITGVVGACLIGVIVKLRNPARSSAHVYLLSDGNYSIDPSTGSCLTAQQVGEYFERLDVWPGRVVVDIAPGRTLDDLCPLLEATAALGFGDYQIRTGDYWLNFELPGCGCGHKIETSPMVIDLRANTSDPYGDVSWCRVLVLVDGTMSCHDLIQNLRRNAASTSSVEVRAGSNEFYCQPDDANPPKSHRNPHRPPSTLGRLLDSFDELGRRVGLH